MTDPIMADSTYIEPIEKNTIEKIIEIERPDAILPIPWEVKQLLMQR